METVGSRGYRFLTPASEVEEPSQRIAPVAPPRTRGVAVIVSAGLAAGALILAIGLIVDPGGLRHWLLRQSSRPIHAIAVLPLTNLSGDPAQE